MDVTAPAIRHLVDRSGDGVPVTSVYLTTDGAQLPKAGDYEARLHALLKDVRKQAERYDEDGRAAVAADADAIERWVRDDFDRGDVKGLAVFASGGEILDTVQVAREMRNQARIGDGAYVVPLEVLLGRHVHIGLVIIERDKARMLTYRLGRLATYTSMTSDVHGQHAQGGNAQGRFERGVEHEVHQHHKEASAILRSAHEVDPFDALVVAGPHTEAIEFTKVLHPYLHDLLHGEPMTLALNASGDELRERMEAVEQELVSTRRSELLQRLFASQGTAEKGAWGMRAVVDAVNMKAVEVLFAVEGAGDPGFRSDSGAVALHEEDARAFGGAVTPVPDLIDELIEDTVRGGGFVEMFRDAVRLDGHPVAALLRF